MREKTGILTVDSLAGFEAKMRNAICEKLGPDKDALKLFQVEWYTPETKQAQMEYDAVGKKILVVSGALGLNDSGQHWRAFNIQIEEGLSEAEDEDVRDQLAHKCLICVAKMKREKRQNGAQVV